MPKSAGYVDADSLRRIAARLQPFKQRLYDLLQLKLGDSVLVAACGPGIDTVPLASRVGPGGHVVGIDLDEDRKAYTKLMRRAVGPGWFPIGRRLERFVQLLR